MNPTQRTIALARPLLGVDDWIPISRVDRRRLLTETNDSEPKKASEEDRGGRGPTAGSGGREGPLDGLEPHVAASARAALRRTLRAELLAPEDSAGRDVAWNAWWIAGATLLSGLAAAMLPSVSDVWYLIPGAAFVIACTSGTLANDIPIRDGRVARWLLGGMPSHIAWAVAGGVSAVALSVAPSIGRREDAHAWDPMFDFGTTLLCFGLVWSAVSGIWWAWRIHRAARIEAMCRADVDGSFGVPGLWLLGAIPFAIAFGGITLISLACIAILAVMSYLGSTPGVAVLGAAIFVASLETVRQTVRE